MSNNSSYDPNYDPDLEEEKAEKKKKLKVYWKIIGGLLLVGGITVGGFAINLNKNNDKENGKEKDSTKKEQQYGDDYVGSTTEITSATINEDGTIDLNNDIEVDDSIENSHYSNESTDISGTTVSNESSATQESSNINNTSIGTDKNNQVNRIVVTAEDIKNVGNNYYTYLNERVEDSSNMVDMGSVYSFVFMANCQYISVDECNKLINAGLIPSDLATTKTEVDNVMSLIMSEDVSKVAVSEFFDTKLDKNNLFELSELFIDETDKSVANYTFNEYCKLISVTNTYGENGNLISDSLTNAWNTYENTRNFFNNCTKYDFEEIGYDAKHFTHNYPVNFTQASVGAQYIIKGIVAPEFSIYVGSNGYATESELAEFQKTIDNVEGPISYLQDKYNGICFTDETVKTYVK